MRYLLPLLAVILACPGPDPAYGTVRVRIDCPSPTAAWARAAVPGLDALGGPAWTVGEPADVTVRCTELPTGLAAGYQPGADYILLDPVQLSGPGGWVFSLALQHELVHWRINAGPHPERALTHLCRLVNELPGDACWSGRHGRALMNPNFLATPPGGVDQIEAGNLPDVEMTWMDGEFLRWGIDP